jgi:hypothetical protein
MADLAHERRSKPPIQPDRPARTSGADAPSPPEEALRKRVAELEAEKAAHAKANAELRVENASLKIELSDLRAANKERDWRDSARDEKIAEQGRDLKELRARVGELSREHKDNTGEQQPNSGIAGRDRDAVSRPEPRDRRHLPSDTANNLIATAAGAGIMDLAYHVRQLSPERAGIAAAGLMVISGGIAWWRERRKEKSDGNHRPEG